MSRCFPFPPPGYEKKDRAEEIDLLKKEKHREKKHKKEKRVKGKRDHKEKKDKDQSKDKHKEKKDRKEKQKEKIKDNDKEKGSTSEDRRAFEGTEGHNVFQNAQSHQRGEGNGFKFPEELGRRTREDWAATRLLGSSSNSIHRRFGVDVASSLESHPREEAKDLKFTEELGQRTRDDGGETRLLGRSSNSIHRNHRAVNITGSSHENERFHDNQALGKQISSAQRRNDGSSWHTENVTSSLQKKTGSISITTTMEKERGKVPEKVTVGRVAEQCRNHGISKSVDDLVRRKMEGINTTAGMEKEIYDEKSMFSNVTAPILEKEKPGTKFAISNHILASHRKTDVLGRSVENLLANSKSLVICSSSFHNSRTDGMGSIPAMEKEGSKGNEVSTFPFLVSSVQRRTSAIAQSAEKDWYQKIECKDKVKDNKAQEKERHKDQDCNDKNAKVNDKDRQTKDKKKDIKDHVYIKPLAPHKDNKPSICVDVTMKKRKFLETNGFLRENDVRPDKIPRMLTSSQLPVNCRILEASINLKPDFHLENKMNGTANPQYLPSELMSQVTGDLVENGEVPLKSLHPDSKYLGTIYAVPKMDEYPEFDDQNWLSDGHDSQRKPKMEFKPKEVPPVWSEALRIVSTDDFALPYVVPF